jgi:hypothetical protein
LVSDHDLGVDGTEYIAVTAPNDQYSEITMVANPTGLIGPCVRMQDAAQFYWAFFFGGTLTIQIRSNAVGDQTIASGSGTVNPGDVVRLEIQGTTLTGKINGATICSGVDTFGTPFNSGGWGFSIINNTTDQISAWAGGDFATGHSISGNAGTQGATISWSGTASGSTTADGSGNYTIPALADGIYTISPSKSGFVFSPGSQNKTVSGANLTGVNFTATAVASGASGLDSDFRFRF